MRKYLKFLTLAVSCASALTVAGCNCGAPTPVDDAGVPGPRCVVDEARVAERPACLADETCPCGTHCELGVCERACTTNDECGGEQRCDTFGRCRYADAQSLTPDPARQRESGAVELLDPVTRVDPATGESVVRVSVVGGEGTRARVRTGHGAQVNCPGTGWTQDCLLKDMPADAITELPVKHDVNAGVQTAANGAPLGISLGDLTLITDNERSSASVQQAPAEAPPPPAFSVTPLSGRYRGQAAAVAYGFVNDAGTPEDLPSEALSVPLTADLFGDSTAATLVLSSPYNPFGAGAFVGTFTLSDPENDRIFTGNATFPVRKLHDGSLGGSESYALALQPVLAQVTVIDQPRSVTVELTQAVLGLGPALTPTITWQVSLDRVGDVTGTAPTLPADYVLPASPATLASTPTRWEAATNAVMGTFAALNDADKSRRFGFLFGRYGLDSCTDLSTSGNTGGRVWTGLWPGVGGTMEFGGQGGPPPQSLFARPEPLAKMLRERLALAPGVTSLISASVTSVNTDSMYPPGRDFEVGKIPCNANFYQGNLPGVGTFASGGNEAWWNNCTELQQATGCRVQYVDTGTSREVRATVGMTATYLTSANPSVPTTTSFNADIDVRWFFECVLPETPVHCATSQSCWPPSLSELSASASTSDFGSSAGLASGDLSCAAGGRSLAIDLDARGDTAGNLPKASEGLDKCVRDFDATFSGPGTTPYAYARGLSALTTTNGCFSPARLIPAIRDGLSSAANASSTADRRVNAAGAYGARLLGRWLTGHSFIAAEAIQKDTMAVALAGTGVPNNLDLSQTLQDSLRGWELVLHPRFANALGALPPHVLAEPDYRVYAVGIAGRTADPQRHGLPAVMLETLSRQSELLSLVLEKGSLKANQSVTQKMAEAMPRFIAARALAGALRSKASLAPAVDWADRYVGADRRFTSGYHRALWQVLAIDEGKNPLGIEDEDLPLYFLAETNAGPGGRFAAISDFLLGTGPGSTAWAPSLVRQSQDALTAARSEYVAQTEREYLTARDERDHKRWVEEVRDQYNQQLRDYCGPVSESLIDDKNFDASRCAINTSNPACLTPPDLYFRGWRTEDVELRFCMHGAMKAATSWSAPAFPSLFLRPSGGFEAAAAKFAAMCTGSTTAKWTGTGPVQLGRCGAGFCLKCTAATVPELPLSNLGTLNLVPGNVDQKTADARFQAAMKQCLGRIPTGRFEPPMPQPALEIPGCVRGSLGEAYLDVVTAARTVEQARNSYSEFNEAYGIAVESCNELSSSVDQKNALRSAHQKNMNGLIAGKAAADSAAAAAAGMKDCMATVASSDKSNPFSAIASAAGAVGTCVSAGVEAGATIASNAIGAAIDTAALEHEKAIAGLEEASEVKRCYIEARLHLVGLKNASLAIKQASFDLQRAQSLVTQEIADAQRSHADGHDYLKEIENFPVRPPTGDLWVSELVTTYNRRFRLARRASYLAVRAVEYEFQVSLGQRGDVLAAETPAQLESVLSDLWTTAGTRTIAGNRPSDLLVVLSLKNDILRVSDASKVPPELQPLSPEERFRMLLKSPRYAQYDTTGRYLGQRIPFALSPLQTLGFETNGVGLFASLDCAERVWSLNASLIGDDPLQGTDTTFLRMDLLKRDVFSSQWCGTAPAADPLQTVSVRPTRNLFREPGFGTTVGSNFGTSQSTAGWSRARIQAYLNVDRQQLENPTYANGQTSELAARGLYGDYALFIPAELIAQETPSGDHTTGLVFDRVSDVLLRVDYVSVAR